MTAIAPRIVIALAVVLVSAQPALADSLSTAAGSGEDTNATVVDERFAGSNFVGSFVVTGLMQGSFQGTYVTDVDLTVHANGRIQGHGFLTFAGKVTGCDTTTVRFRLIATGAFPEDGGPAVIEGRMVAVASDLQANLAFDEVGNFFTYAGTYHCRQ